MRANIMDNVDKEIIKLLKENGRANYSEIAQKVGLTRTAIKNRIIALENSGVIAGYRAIINLVDTPQAMTFIIDIETQLEVFEKAKEYLARAEETITLVQTTGACRLTAVCVTADISSLRSFIGAVYKTVGGIVNITAHAVLEVIKGGVN